MDKKLAVLMALFVFPTALVMAQEAATQPAATVAEPAATVSEPAPAVESNATAAEPAADEMAAIDVGNTICPLTGRELNLEDPNDYTTLEAEGLVFNVCPKGKADYDKDPSKYADKIAKAVADASAMEGDAVEAGEPVEESAAEPAEATEPAAEAPAQPAAAKSTY